MPAEVQLIAGPARCEKTSRLLAAYRRQLGRSVGGARAATEWVAECFWLAPNQTAAAQLQNSLLETSTVGLLRPNLCTFAQFAETLITRSRRRIQPISSAQKRRLLQQSIKATSDQGKLDHFARVASTPGFVIQVDQFIAELKRKDIWPEEFSQRTGSDRRARELSRIYAAYQKILLRSELYDTEGRFWAAREILTAAAATGRQPFDLIVVNGFHDFTASQYDILRLLGESSSQLLISLTVEQPSSEALADPIGDGQRSTLTFEKTSGTLSRLQETLPQLKVKYLAASPPGQDSLRQLQQQLFREPLTSSSDKAPLDNVEIVAANSGLGEIEAIAEKIKTLLLAGQAQPEEIVVVCQGGERMVELIAAVFPDYGIPFAAEMRPRLDSEPLFRSLSALLRLHHEDWPFQTLLEVINNRLLTRLDATGDGASGDGPAGDRASGETAAGEMATSFHLQPRVALEYCVRSAQLPAGRQALLEQLEYRQHLTAQLQVAANQQRAAQAAIALGEFRQLDQLLAALPARATINGWLRALEELLTQLGALSAQASPAAQNVETENGARSARCWNLLQRVLGSVAQADAWSLAAEPLLELPELQALLATVAHQQRLPAGHDAVGRVRILSAESARKLPVEHLFLAGLTEQAFPSATPAEQSSAGRSETDDSQALLANFSELAAMPDIATPGEIASPEILGDSAAPDIRLSDGMLLFYELVSRATQSLTLSYPALDAKGQSLPPSPLLTELQRSVGADRIGRRTMALGEVVRRDIGPLSRGSFRRQAVDQALEGCQQWLAGMISHPEFARTGSSILSGIECVAERGVRDSFGPYEGLILSETALAAFTQRFDAQHLWSSSQLEGYATCPFRFFSEHLLKLEPLSELALSNDARRRGSLLHQVLATIHQQLSEVVAEPGKDLVAVDLVERFLTTLDATVGATPLRGIEQSLREIERREIEAWAPSYAEQEINYRRQWKHLDQPPTPACFEVRFGPDTRTSADEPSDPASTSVPFELDLGDEQICLTGQIDRIDIGRVGQVTVFNIIDYKSGKEVKLKLDKVRAGCQLQLPLYVLAAEQLLLADQQAHALAAGYWNIQGKGFETRRGGSLHVRELANQTLQISHEWQQLQPEIVAQVRQLVGGIRGGQFPVYNEEEDCTRSCSLSTVCRVAQIRSLEKVWPITDDAPPDANQAAPKKDRGEHR